MQVYLEHLPNLVAATRVCDDLDDASDQLITARPIRNALVRGNEQVKISFFEDLLEQLNHLNGKDVLSQVVIGLENAADYFDLFVGLPVVVRFIVSVRQRTLLLPLVELTVDLLEHVKPHSTLLELRVFELIEPVLDLDHLVLLF